MTTSITAHHTVTIVEGYELGESSRLEKHLSRFVEGEFRVVPSGFMYDDEKKRLLIPRGVDTNYISRVLEKPVNTDFSADESAKISIKLKAKPRNDYQRESIAFLLGENQYSYTKRYSQLLLEGSTGSGKTFAATAAMSFIGTKTMVITHIQKIKNQWLNNFYTKTDLTEKQVCDIDGSNIAEMLLDTPKNKIPYKVFIVNHATLASFAKKHGWDKVGELFRHLQIGLKIFDEAHLCWENIIKVDCNTNTKRTFYLTATFKRTDRNEQRLFSTCFNGIAKFTTDNEANRKHVIYLGVTYNSNPPYDMQSHMQTYKGFSKIRYTDYIIETPEFWYVLDYVLKYVNTKVTGKVLLLSSKIESANLIADYIKEHFEDKSIGVYHSKISDAEKIKAAEADIISSTPQSFGTGADIPGLRAVIVLESYSSEVQAEQLVGRLRPYSEDDNTLFVEIVDIGFKRAQRMFKDRQKIFLKKCLKVTQIDLTKYIIKEGKF